MKWSIRSSLAVATVLVLLPGAALTAQAAVPTNDTVAGATVISTLPTTITQNTTQATTDATDIAANTYCGAPATNGSVWFSYTASADGGVLADGLASDFSMGFIITEGAPTADSLIACGPGQVGFNVTAGATYYVMAFSDTPGVTGGNLSVTFTAAPPPPTLSVTVDPKGVAYKDGSAKITGTYTCTSGDFVDLFGSVTQKVGRLKIVGDFFTEEFMCDGAPHQWTAYATSNNGYFAGGKAASVTMAFACNFWQCADGYVERTVQLTRAATR